MPSYLPPLEGLQLALRDEALFIRAVEASVLPQLNPPGICQTRPYLPNGSRVSCLGCPDEDVILDLCRLKERAECLGFAACVLLWRQALGGCLLLDLEAMLVGAHCEVDLVACHSLESGDCLPQGDGVEVADVGVGVDVEDGGGDEPGGEAPARARRTLA